MFNTVTPNIVAKAQEYSQLKDIAAQADTVRAVEKALDEIGRELRRAAVLYPVLEPLIPEESAEAIRQEAAKLQRQLEASQHEFAQRNFQQMVRLAQIRARSGALSGRMADAWRAYTYDKLGPYRELAQIAERLPAMEDRVEQIRGNLSNAMALASDLPAKAQAVAQFHAFLDHLDSFLSGLEGLPGDVRVFLDKLLRGEATVADMSMTVLDWCRAEGIAGKLRIARL